MLDKIDNGENSNGENFAKDLRTLRFEKFFGILINCVSPMFGMVSQSFRLWMVETFVSPPMRLL